MAASYQRQHKGGAHLLHPPSDDLLPLRDDSAKAYRHSLSRTRSHVGDDHRQAGSKALA